MAGMGRWSTSLGTQYLPNLLTQDPQRPRRDLWQRPAGQWGSCYDPRFIVPWPPQLGWKRGNYHLVDPYPRPLLYLWGRPPRPGWGGGGPLADWPGGRHVTSGDQSAGLSQGNGLGSRVRTRAPRTPLHPQPWSLFVPTPLGSCCSQP